MYFSLLVVEMVAHLVNSRNGTLANIAVMDAKDAIRLVRVNAAQLL